MQSARVLPLPGQPPRHWRGWLTFLVKLGVSGGCLWYLAKSVDTHALWRQLTIVSPVSLALSLLPFLAIAIVGGVRWWVVLRALRQPFRLGSLISLFWAGMFFNQILPSAAGDAVRVWLSVRRGLRVSAAVHSIALERVAMVLILLMLVVGTQPLLAGAAPGGAEPIWVPILFLGAGLAGLGLLSILDQIPGTVVRRGRLHWLVALSGDARRVVLSNWTGPLALLCLIGNLNFVVAGWVLGGALGFRLPFEDYLAFIPLVVAVTVIPISIGGWGLREGVLVALFAKVGVAREAALAYSVMFGVFSALASLPGLAAWWLDAERRASQANA